MSPRVRYNTVSGPTGATQPGRRPGHLKKRTAWKPPVANFAQLCQNGFSKVTLLEPPDHSRCIDCEPFAAQLHSTYSRTRHSLLILILMLSIIGARAQHHLECCYLSPLRKRPWTAESLWQSNMRVSGHEVRRDSVGTKRRASWDKHGPRVPLRFW
jgi:hypothetical protein